MIKWKVVARPEAKDDILQAAKWYSEQRADLGDEFVEEIVAIFDELTTDPLFQSRPHPARNIRWRYPKRFPYRVIYEVIEEQRVVVIAAVIHAARDNRAWRRRFD